jgi:hypothetical protein
MSENDDAERLTMYKRYGDTIVSRIELADALNLSPNRVSELVRLGDSALQVATKKPLMFSLEHNVACYESYRWWLDHKRPGERYA